MKKYVILYISMFLFVLSVFRCSPPEKDEIKLIITCDGEFSGDYYINGVYASIDNIIEAESVYRYEITFDDLNFLEVFVTRNACNQTLRISIYRNSERVKNAILSAVSSETCTNNTLEFTYEYDEENKQTQTTST